MTGNVPASLSDDLQQNRSRFATGLKLREPHFGEGPDEHGDLSIGARLDQALISLATEVDEHGNSMGPHSGERLEIGSAQSATTNKVGLHSSRKPPLPVGLVPQPPAARGTLGWEVDWNYWHNRQNENLEYWYGLGELMMNNFLTKANREGTCIPQGRPAQSFWYEERRSDRPIGIDDSTAAWRKVGPPLNSMSPEQSQPPIEWTGVLKLWKSATHGVLRALPPEKNSSGNKVRNTAASCAAAFLRKTVAAAVSMENAQSTEAAAVSVENAQSDLNYAGQNREDNLADGVTREGLRQGGVVVPRGAIDKYELHDGDVVRALVVAPQPGSGLSFTLIDVLDVARADDTKSGELLTLTGIFEQVKEGIGFVRPSSEDYSRDDLDLRLHRGAFVPMTLVERFGLTDGEKITAQVRPAASTKFPATVVSITDTHSDEGTYAGDIWRLILEPAESSSGDPLPEELAALRGKRLHGKVSQVIGKPRLKFGFLQAEHHSIREDIFFHPKGIAEPPWYWAPYTPLVGEGVSFKLEARRTPQGTWRLIAIDLHFHERNSGRKEVPEDDKQCKQALAGAPAGSSVWQLLGAPAGDLEKETVETTVHASEGVPMWPHKVQPAGTLREAPPRAPAAAMAPAGPPVGVQPMARAPAWARAEVPATARATTMAPSVSMGVSPTARSLLWARAQVSATAPARAMAPAGPAYPPAKPPETAPVTPPKAAPVTPPKVPMIALVRPKPPLNGKRTARPQSRLRGTVRAASHDEDRRLRCSVDEIGNARGGSAYLETVRPTTAPYLERAAILGDSDEHTEASEEEEADEFVFFNQLQEEEEEDQQHEEEEEQALDEESGDWNDLEEDSGDWQDENPDAELQVAPCEELEQPKDFAEEGTDVSEVDDGAVGRRIRKRTQGQGGERRYKGQTRKRLQHTETPQDVAPWRKRAVVSEVSDLQVKNHREADWHADQPVGQPEGRQADRWQISGSSWQSPPPPPPPDPRRTPPPPPPDPRRTWPAGDHRPAVTRPAVTRSGFQSNQAPWKKKRHHQEIAEENNEDYESGVRDSLMSQIRSLKRKQNQDQSLED